MMDAEPATPDETETLVETVPSVLAGERIDRLVSLSADVSRSQARDLIKAGAVLINGQVPAKPSERVATDDEVTITVTPVDTSLRPDPTVEFDLIHADDEVAVVDKPAGLVVHPGSGVNDATLAHGLLARFPSITMVGEPDRPGIVHRLDRGTSGLLMVALTEAALSHLSHQLAERTVTRRYLALVDGIVEAEGGVIDAPLGRSVRRPTLRSVVADGRPARTHYEVLTRYEEAGLTLVACRLETGRTHQIRVHLSAIGHPVLGDKSYGAPDDDHGLGRPFLHAQHLGFDHPATGERLEFDSPLPPDLGRVVEDLNQNQA